VSSSLKSKSEVIGIFLIGGMGVGGRRRYAARRATRATSSGVFGAGSA
jgi:hypothetical protein